MLTRVRIEAASDLAIAWHMAKLDGWQDSNPPAEGELRAYNWQMKKHRQRRFLQVIRYDDDMKFFRGLLMKERISLTLKHDGIWFAFVYNVNDEKTHMQAGGDPIKAVFRCYLAKMHGAYLSVPEELLKEDHK